MYIFAIPLTQAFNVSLKIKVTSLEHHQQEEIQANLQWFGLV